VKPDALGWGPVAKISGVEEITQDLGKNLMRWVIGCVFVYAALFRHRATLLWPAWLWICAGTGIVDVRCGIVSADAEANRMARLAAPHVMPQLVIPSGARNLLFPCAIGTLLMPAPIVPEVSGHLHIIFGTQY